VQNFFTVAMPLVAAVTTSTASLPFSSYKLQGPPPPVEEKPYSIIKEFEPETTAIREVAPPKPKELRLICKGCNEHENATLAFFQDRGIKDRNALATIMGNIRQESTFFPNICEGGARVTYHNCRSGGYGLIQWTDSTRYNGLGNFASRTNGNPSTIETQLNYMINEPDWKMIEQRMMQPGGTINDYMRLARKWIRWGHHGARTDFAYDYRQRLVLAEI
jgi:hypothetical protein